MNKKNEKLDQKISKIISNLKSIKIQGATNVAYAVLEGMKLVVTEDHFAGDLEKEALEVGKQLSRVRENEPLARNAVRYVEQRVSGNKDSIIQACQDYEKILLGVKNQIASNGVKVLQNEKTILTHCRSTTTTNILIEVNKKRKKEEKTLSVVSTETRPLYQGRKTVKELINAGISVIQIVDGAAPSFLVGSSALSIGAVIVGCDELLSDGSFVNKVGTFSIALAAQTGSIKFFIATTLLKLNTRKKSKKLTIEERPAYEVWKHAPEGLKIINPAFDLVPSQYVYGYITEAGVLKQKDLIPQAKRLYPWLFENSY